MSDGVVKSPISFVVGFYHNLKGALTSLTFSLARELAGEGITDEIININGGLLFD